MRKLPRPVTTWLVVAAIVAVALTMRSPVTSLGALLSDIRGDLNVGGGLAGFLTSAPTVLFGLSAMAMPWLSRRVSDAGLAVIALVIVALGTAGRVVGEVPGLVLGTVAAMVGIGILNVLLPVIVRNWFPTRQGWLTGIYVAAMQIGAAGASYLSVPLADGGHAWRSGLAWWAVIPVIAALCWAVLSVTTQHRSSSSSGLSPMASALTYRSLLRDPTALALMVFFGLQSAGAYIIMGWMPTVYRDAGMDPDTAGLMLAITMAAQIPMSLIYPPWVAARQDQRWFLPVFAVPYVIGFLGLWLAPMTTPALWAIAIGVGMSSFPVALMFIGLRTTEPGDTAVVSAFTQGIGYLIAVFGPLLFGIIGDATGSFDVPLILTLVILIPVIVTGWVIGGDRLIGST